MFSRKAIQVLFVAAILGFNLCTPASAESEKGFYETIEKLEKIAQIKKLEAEIAKYEARKLKAIADKEKANAKRIWAKVAAEKGRIALKDVKSGKIEAVKEDKGEKK